MPFGERVERPKTLVFCVPEQLRNGSSEDFLAKLVSALRGHDLLCVQFVPNFYVRVTFRLLESRRSVFREGLRIDDVEIPLIEADSSFRRVYVHHCPYEVSDDAIAAVLADYGTVLGVEHPFYRGSTVYTGSRVFKMSLDSAVPPKLYILRYPCRVWYKDQPLDCRICESPSHRAADCPLRGLCRKCRQPGHFERNCPGVPPPADAAPTASPADDAPPAADTVATDVPPAPPADDGMGDVDLACGDEESSPLPGTSASLLVPSESAAPSVSADAEAVSDSDTASSGDDEEMGDNDLASGDEEVLAAAGRVSLSPRRTRPSTRAASCSPDFTSSFVLPPSVPPSVCRDSAPSSSSAEPSPVAAPPAAAPVELDPDVAVSSGDDEGMGDDDLASGDEEVLAAAGHVSLSPRRTRSSTRAASCSPDPASPVVSPPSIPPSGVSASPADDCDSSPSSFAAVPSSAAVVCDSAPSSSAAVPSPAAGDSVPAAEPCDLSDDVALDVVAASSRALVLSATGLGPFALSLFAVCPFRSGDLFSIADFGYTTRRIMSDTATFEMYRECHYMDRPGSVPVMSTFPSDRGPLPPDIVLDQSVLPSKFPGKRSP